jgi:anti-sigma factor (TIGR02949 family)
MSAVDRYTCEEVFRRLNDYLDRELSGPEMAMVKEHLETCAQCASEHAFEESVLRELKAKLRRIDVPQSLIEKVEAILSDHRLREGE